MLKRFRSSSSSLSSTTTNNNKTNLLFSSSSSSSYYYYNLFSSSKWYDAIVIGLGGVGSFALRGLKQQGIGGTFLGLEQYPILFPINNSNNNKNNNTYCYDTNSYYNNPYGSSHGLSRIYRQAYFEHPNYVPWIRYSISQFHILQNQYLQQEQQQQHPNNTNQNNQNIIKKNHSHNNNNNNNNNNKKKKNNQNPLIQECGTLIIEPCSNQQQYCQLSYETAKRHNIDIRKYNDFELRQSFPQFNYNITTTTSSSASTSATTTTTTNDEVLMQGIYEPNGGFVRPEKIIQAALLDAITTTKTNNHNKNNNNNNNNKAKHDLVNDSGKIDIWQETRVTSWNYLPETITSYGKPLIEVHIEKKITSSAGSITSTTTSNPTTRTNDNDNSNRIEKHVVITPCLLISAGAWTGQLIPTWSPYLKPHRQLQGWIPYSHNHHHDDDDDDDNNYDDDLFGYNRMPTWFMITPSYHLPIYGVPADHDNNCGVKVGIHGRTDYITNPSKMSKNNFVISSNNTEWNELEYAAKASLHPNAWKNKKKKQEEDKQMTMKHDNNNNNQNNNNNDNKNNRWIHQISPCMYTMTPDSHFFIGSPYPSVFAIAGLSGHGFKQIPALGQMMVSHALRCDTTTSCTTTTNHHHHHHDVSSSSSSSQQQSDENDENESNNHLLSSLLNDWEFCSPTRFNIPDEIMGKKGEK